MATQLFTSTINTALGYANQQKVALLCDGSLAVFDNDGTNGHLYQVTSPTSSPTTTSIKTFTASGAPDGSVFVLNNGTTSSDVWIAYGYNSSVTSIYVAHGTYTASGSTWSWDNNGTAIFTSQNFVTPTIVWTGTYLILATRDSGYAVATTYTSTMSGASGWSSLANISTTTSSNSHQFPILLHDPTNSCTVIVYSQGGDTLYARVLADSSAPAVANWSSATALTSGALNIGAAYITAVLDPGNKNLHVAYCDSTSGAVNPKYQVATYTTTSVTAGTPFSITGGSGTAATSPSIAIDTLGKIYLFWAGAAAGAASDISYVTIASPYASGNVSAITNLTNASSNDNIYPHVPKQAALSSYIPLIYQYSAASPYAVMLDTSITISNSYNGAATISGHAALSAAGNSSGVGAATISGHAALKATGFEVVTGAAKITAHGTITVTSNVPGTGIGDLAVTTKSQTWTNVPGSPGTETDVTYTDSTGSGWSVGLIPSYGGMPISSWYEVDKNVFGSNQTALTTTVPDGHIHWLEQLSGGAFGGSEDKPFTMTELAPTGTAFRRYYQTSFGPDVDGFYWTGYACIYPGDPGFIAYRFDMQNPSTSAVALASSDSLEIALIGGLQQTDSTWQYTNGGYGTLAGGNTTPWPVASTNGNAVSADPDYVYIAPSNGAATQVGQITVKQKSVSAYSPPWSSAAISVLANTSRMKIKIFGTQTSFPGSTTSTVYLLNVMRRSLTGSDAYAIAADYINPGTPTMTYGTYTTFSYDERAYVFAPGANNTVTTTLDLSPAHVTVRYKPVLKVTGWTGGNPALTWGGAALTAGVDYRFYVDTTNNVLYIQLYFDVIPSTASSPANGQRKNAALNIQPTLVTGAVTISGHGAIRANGTPVRTVPAHISLVATPTRSVAAHAALQSLFTRGAPAHAALQSTLTRSAPVHAALTASVTRTASAHVALQSTLTRSASAHAALQRTFVRQAQASITLSAVLTRSVQAHASIQGGLNRQVQTRIALSAVLTRSAASHLALQSTLTRTSSAHAALQSTLVRSASAHGALVATPTRTVAAHVALQSTLTRTSSAHVALQSTLTRAVAAHVAVYTANLMRPVAAHVALYGTLTRSVTATIPLRAFIQRSAPTHVALSGQAQRSVVAHVALQSTLTRPVSAHAALQSLFVRSATTGAALSSRPTRSVVTHGALQSALTRSTSAHAAFIATILRNAPATVALDAALKRSVSATVPLRATVQRSVTARIALDGSLSRSVGVTVALQSVGLKRSAPAHASFISALTRPVTTHVAIQATPARQVQTHSALLGTPTRPVLAHAALQANMVRAVSAHATLQSALTRAVTVHVALQSAPTRPVLARTALQSTLTRSTISRAALLGTLTRPVTNKGALQSTLTRPVTNKGALQSTLTRPVAAHLAISGALFRSVPAHGALQSTLTRPVSAHVSLSPTLMRSVAVAIAITYPIILAATPIAMQIPGGAACTLSTLANDTITLSVK